jgi:hypothetical protein
MWHTPEGDRVLRGSEAALLKAAMTDVAERIREESSGHSGQWDYGIQLFDELPWSQRLVLLECVATYLFTETDEPLHLTAVNEATIGVLFEHIRSEIDLEIEDPTHTDTRWRGRVLAAYEACFCVDGIDITVDEDDDFVRPVVISEDRDAWSDLVESLADRILWDRDYEMDSLFLDTAPDKAEMIKQYLGIDSDYFSTAAPDVATDEAAASLFQRLDQLIHGPS